MRELLSWPPMTVPCYAEKCDPSLFCWTPRAKEHAEHELRWTVSRRSARVATRLLARDHLGFALFQR